MAAEVVWEYADPALFARTKGDVDRLDNGNTRITYPDLTTTRESLLLEVAPNGDVVWDLRTDPGWESYRSEPIRPQYGSVFSPH